MDILQTAQTYFEIGVKWCLLAAEIGGVIVLVVTLVQSFWMWLRGSPRLKLHLLQGIALALDFRMGAEALRSVVVREWNELAILGAVILLRGLMALILHWSIRDEERRVSEGKSNVENLSPQFLRRLAKKKAVVNVDKVVPSEEEIAS